MAELASRHGDLHSAALAGSGLALAATYGGDPDPAAETALAELDQRPLSPSGRGWVAYTRGELCHRHDPQQALVHYEDALREARTVNNRYLEGAAIVSSCSLRARTGDPFEALGDFADAVNHWNRVANTPEQLTTLRNLAVLLQRVNAPEALAELLGAVDRSDTPTYGEEADRLDNAAHLGEHHARRRTIQRTDRSRRERNVTAAANAALNASTHYCGEQARQATNRRSQSADHTRCDASQGRTHASWNRVVRCPPLSHESGTQPRSVTRHRTCYTSGLTESSNGGGGP